MCNYNAMCLCVCGEQFKCELYIYLDRKQVYEWKVPIAQILGFFFGAMENSRWRKLVAALIILFYLTMKM